jgi:hypothetical protein
MWPTALPTAGPRRLARESLRHPTHRDGGDTKVPCAIQYGYSHLLREVQDLEKEFPDVAEVTAFVSTVAPQLALAMGLRAQPISDPEFARQAAALKVPLMASMEEPAQHLGIRRLQETLQRYLIQPGGLCRLRCARNAWWFLCWIQVTNCRTSAIV